jgi:3-oxosteroid 1-dehydrogenase
MTVDEVDVVVVGSGISGLAAALSAARLGLETLLVEKADRLGGGTTYSYGLLWAGGTRAAVEAGVRDDPEDVLRYLRFVASGAQDEDRLRAYVEHSAAALDAYAAAGIEFRLVRGLTDHYYGTAPGATAFGRTLEVPLIAGDRLGAWQHRIELPPPGSEYRLTAEELVSWGGMNSASSWDQDLMRKRADADLRGLGVGLVSTFVAALLECGAGIRTGVGADRLVVRDGRVGGVELVDGTRLGARRGVVLAAGGYESNPRLTDNYEALPGYLSMYTSALAGDALVMATEQGAAVRYIHNTLQVMLGLRVPVPDPPGWVFRLAGIIELCSPHTLVVNHAGQRFANEAHFQYMAPKLREFDVGSRQYVNLPCHLVFDSRYAERFSFAGRPAGSPLPDWVARADSIAGLAHQLGVDAAGLVRTVSRFNGFAESGVDSDFGRGAQKWSLAAPDRRSSGPNPMLGPVGEPPFYGVQLHPSSSSSAGLDTDEHARVRHVRGHPMPGLYATGGTAAHTEYGTGYQHGLSLMSGLVFGHLAAQHLLTA